MLHSFTTDLSKHVEGIPESHGLIQGIRPHHELFRRELKKTAPDFRPYERRYASQRTLDPPKFLSNEEGTDDEVEEMRESLSLPPSPDHQQANTVIYIDEVMERAQQCVNFIVSKCGHVLMYLCVGRELANSPAIFLMSYKRRLLRNSGRNGTSLPGDFANQSSRW